MADKGEEREVADKGAEREMAVEGTSPGGRPLSDGVNDPNGIKDPAAATATGAAGQPEVGDGDLELPGAVNSRVSVGVLILLLILTLTLTLALTLTLTLTLICVPFTD